MFHSLFRWTTRNFEQVACGFGLLCILALTAMPPIVWSR